MKLKQEFVLRTIAGDTVLIPVGKLGDKFHGVITLNETGKFIWEKLEEGKEPADIAAALTDEYEVPYQKAVDDVGKICGQLRELGVL